MRNRPDSMFRVIPLIERLIVRYFTLLKVWSHLTSTSISISISLDHIVFYFRIKIDSSVNRSESKHVGLVKRERKKRVTCSISVYGKVIQSIGIGMVRYFTLLEVCSQRQSTSIYSSSLWIISCPVFPWEFAPAAKSSESVRVVVESYDQAITYAKSGGAYIVGSAKSGGARWGFLTTRGGPYWAKRRAVTKRGYKPALY